jgi:hypothetical protein
LIGTSERVQDDNQITVMVSLQESNVAGSVERKLGKAPIARYDSKASVEFQRTQFSFLELQPHVFRTLDFHADTVRCPNEMLISLLILQCSLENGAEAVLVRGEMQGPEISFDNNVIDHARYLFILTSMFEDKSTAQEEKVESVPNTDESSSLSRSFTSAQVMIEVNAGYCTIFAGDGESKDLQSSPQHRILHQKLPSLRLGFSHAKNGIEVSSITDISVSRDVLFHF